MNSIELWTGLPGSGREAKALKKTVAACRSGKRVLWIVDRRLHALLLEQKALDMSGGFLSGLSVVAAGRLALYILEEAVVNAPTLDVEERGLMLWDFLRDSEINKTRKLSRGWERIAVEAYKNIKSEIGTKRQKLKEKLNRSYPWLLESIEEYEKLLAEKGYMDESDLPFIAKELIEEKNVLPWDIVFINRLGPAPDPTMMLLECVAKNSPEAHILVDYCEENAPALNLSKLDYQRWIRFPGVEKKTFPLEKSNHQLAAQLFNGFPEKNREQQKSIGISYNRNILYEVKSVAESISKQVHEKNIDPSDVVVICTDLEKYIPYLEAFFPRYGLEVGHSLGVKLNRLQIISLVADILSIKSCGFAPNVVIRVLRNPLFKQNKSFKEADIYTLDLLSKLARIRWGSLDYNKSWIEPISSLDEKRIKQQGISLSDRKRALWSFEAFAKTLTKEFNKKSDSPILDWLEKRLHQFGVIEYLDRLEEKNKPQGILNKRALSKLYLLDRSITKTTRLRSKNRLNVETYRENFEKLTKQLSVDGPPRHGQEILAVGSLDLRGLKKKYSYFMGATSRAWPQPVRGTVLDPNGAFESVLVQQAEFRALTYELLANSENVTISIPCPQKSEGEDKPSSFLHEIEMAGIVCEELQGSSDRTIRTSYDLLPWLASATSVQRKELFGSLKDKKGINSIADSGDIDRAINVEKSRQDPGSLTEYNGFISKGDLLNNLTNEVLGKPFSVSKLDCYALCPMWFFIERVLGVGKDPEIEEGFEVFEEGNLIHNILADANRELRKRNLGIGDNSQATFNILLLCAEAHIKPNHKENAIIWARCEEIVGGLADSSKSGTLKKMVENYKERGFENAVPVFVEASFGMDESGEDVVTVKPLKIKIKDGIVELAGRVDLVVYDSEKGYYLVDYKSGTLKPTSDSKNGVSFQLPVYLMALEAYLGTKETEENKISGAEYYSTKHNKLGKYNYEKNYVKEKEEVKRFIEDIVVAIKNGHFHQPLTQSAKHCKADEHNYCPYIDVCRKDHQLFEAREVKMDIEVIKNAYVPPTHKILSKRLEEK